MSDEAGFIQAAQNFLDDAIAHTHYEPKLQAEKVFGEIKTRLTVTLTSDAECKLLVQRVKNLSAAVSSQVAFQNNVKVLWRMVKDKNGQPWYKLCLLVAGICATYTTARHNKNAAFQEVEKWKKDIAKWLGRQLTIGGKGVTGDAEGSVLDRIARFFRTPYLHDFD